MDVPNRTIPRAIVAPRSADPSAAQRAILWVLTQSQDLGGRPLLYAPGRRNIKQSPQLSAFATRAASETWRTLNSARWSGGVVLAAWPDSAHLAEVDEDPRTRGLCVLTWQQKDAEAWATAWQPEHLSPGAAPAPPATVSDAVVEQALLTLSALVNHGNELSGALDHRDAVNVLLTLHDGGHQLDAQRIYAWALAHGWPAGGAARLRDLAERVQAGQRPRVDRTALRSDVLERWRSAAQDVDD